MKKSSKKLIASVMACTLVGTLAFNGTLAYLTDSEGAANVVTVARSRLIWRSLAIRETTVMR